MQVEYKTTLAQETVNGCHAPEQRKQQEQAVNVQHPWAGSVPLKRCKEQGISAVMMGAVEDIMNRLRGEVSELASRRLKTLLETKHLYQRVSIDPKEIIDAMRPTVSSFESGEFEYSVSALPLSKFGLIARRSSFVTAYRSEQAPVFDIVFGIENVKMFCQTCEEREVFSPLGFWEMRSELENRGVMVQIELPLPQAFNIPQIFV